MYEGHPCRRVRCGDVDAAFGRADHIVEGRYDTSPIEQAPTETTGCIAVPEANGRFTVYTNTQALYFSLDNTSIILQVPGNQLHFVGGTVGGGFGGKVDVIVEPIATLAAMRTGRPVRYVYSRSEEMQVSSTRAAWRIYVKDGVTSDGRIIARKVTSYADSGAYSRQTPYALTKHAANAAGPYAIPNVSIDAYCVYTNRQPSSAMRGFGVTMASFALEVQMDKIAETVGLDPWTIRFINAYRDGDMKPHRKLAEDATLIETMQAAAALVGHELTAELRAMTSAPRRETGERRDMAKLRGTGHRRRQLPHRDEPRRRSLAGPGPCHDQRLVRRHAVGHRPRPGAAHRDRADRRRDPGGRPTRRSSSTPPTPTPVRTTWAPSPAGPPIGSATP